MKGNTIKRVFVLVGLLVLFLLAGCTGREQSFLATIQNQSSQPVTYKIGGLSESVIAVGDSVTIDRPLNQYMEYYHPEKRITLQDKYLGDNHLSYTFSDRKAYNLKITNSTGIVTILSASGWMEPDSIEIGAASTELTNTTWKIYSDKPVFSIDASGYPLIADYEIVGNDCLVIIR